MESIDARKVPEGLDERRKQVVRLSKKGYGPMAIAELTGLSRGAVNAALKAYEPNIIIFNNFPRTMKPF